MMMFTTTALQRFMRGQIEIIEEKGLHVLRGDIQSVTAQQIGGTLTLVVVPRWMAKRNKIGPSSWMKDRVRKYEIGIPDCSISSPGEGRLDFVTQARIKISLFPPNYKDNISPTDVQGLRT
jgi:hypothetical protein